MVEACGNLVRNALVFMNFIIFVLAASLEMYILWVMKKKTAEEKKPEDNIPEYVLIAAVSFGMLLSFLGCFGAFMEQRCILLLFSFFMSLILVTMIVGVCLAYQYKDKSDETIRSVYRDFIKKYAATTRAKKVMDSLHRKYKCCGVMDKDNSETDIWKIWAKLNKELFGEKRKIPESCCKEKEKIKECVKNPTKLNAYLEDCVTKLREFTSKHAIYIIGVAGAVMLTLVIGITLSYVLYCQINNEIALS